VPGLAKHTPESGSPRLCPESVRLDSALPDIRPFAQGTRVSPAPRSAPPQPAVPAPVAPAGEIVPPGP
jgi:hypothetical protein